MDCTGILLASFWHAKLSQGSSACVSSELRSLSCTCIALNKWAMKVPISTVQNSSLLSACQLVVHADITVCASGGPSRSSSETSRAVRSIHVTSGESGQASLASPTVTLCLLLNASAILTYEQGDYLSCCSARARRLHLGER